MGDGKGGEGSRQATARRKTIESANKASGLPFRVDKMLF